VRIVIDAEFVDGAARFRPLATDAVSSRYVDRVLDQFDHSEPEFVLHYREAVHRNEHGGAGGDQGVYLANMPFARIAFSVHRTKGDQSFRGLPMLSWVPKRLRPRAIGSGPVDVCPPVVVEAAGRQGWQSQSFDL
jgi:hypothetical protein